MSGKDRRIVVLIPNILKLSLECGFVSFKGGRHYPVDSCTLNLREHGEGGSTSSDYGFEFTAGIYFNIVFIIPNNIAL